MTESLVHLLVFWIALAATLAVAMVLMIVLVKFLRAVAIRLREFFDGRRPPQGS